MDVRKSSMFFSSTGAKGRVGGPKAGAGATALQPAHALRCVCSHKQGYPPTAARANQAHCRRRFNLCSHLEKGGSKSGSMHVGGRAVGNSRRAVASLKTTLYKASSRLAREI